MKRLILVLCATFFYTTSPLAPALRGFSQNLNSLTQALYNQSRQTDFGLQQNIPSQTNRYNYPPQTNVGFQQNPPSGENKRPAKSNLEVTRSGSDEIIITDRRTVKPEKMAAEQMNRFHIGGDADGLYQAFINLYNKDHKLFGKGWGLVRNANQKTEFIKLGLFKQGGTTLIFTSEGNKQKFIGDFEGSYPKKGEMVYYQIRNIESIGNDKKIANPTSPGQATVFENQETINKYLLPSESSIKITKLSQEEFANMPKQPAQKL